MTLVGVPDCLRCIIFKMSLPGDGTGNLSPISGKCGPLPEQELGDGLLELIRCTEDISPIFLSFSSMILAGDFMSTFGRPTLVNDFVVDATCDDVVDDDFFTKAEADVMKSSLLESYNKKKLCKGQFLTPSLLFHTIMP